MHTSLTWHYVSIIQLVKLAWLHNTHTHHACTHTPEYKAHFDQHCHMWHKSLNVSQCTSSYHAQIIPTATTWTQNSIMLKYAFIHSFITSLEAISNSILKSIHCRRQELTQRYKKSKKLREVVLKEYFSENGDLYFHTSWPRIHPFSMAKDPSFQHGQGGYYTSW